MIRALSVCLLVMVAWSATAKEKDDITPGSLTIEDIIQRSKAGVSDDLIIASLKKNAKAFNLNTDEIGALKKEGVSDRVINYMLDPTQPYSPAPPPTAAAATPKPPSDPLALKVPPEIGIYYLTTTQDFVPLELKPVVPSKQPGKFSALLRIKGHYIGSIAGPVAKTRVKGDSPIFFARLGEKTSADDLTLVSLEQAHDHRDLDFGPKKGEPIFPPKSVHQFDSKEVSPGIYRFSVPPIKPGQYMFFILGSGDDRKGQLGRGYTFGVN